MAFEDSVDAGELDFIETVARHLIPDAWETCPQYRRAAGDWVRAVDGTLVIDAEQTAVVAAVRERNRQLARNKAIDLIELVRERDPARGRGRTGPAA